METEAEVARVAELQAKLDMEHSQFEEDKAKMASVVHLPSTAVIKLDVGGRQFKTTTATLCREESMLSAMFSGKGFKVEKDEDGFFFIDRPGAPFEHILHYLQTGVFIPPTDPALLKAVQLEADFYQIESLIDQSTWHDFTFSDLDDNRGVLYWLGTKKGTALYRSPVDAGLVKVVGAYNGRNLIERTAGDGGCCYALDQSFTIELPVAVRPNRYCLSYATATGCRRPANWSLSASVDGKAWATLCAHVDDRSLIKANRASWPIPEQEQAFKRFQLTCTGASEGDEEDEDELDEDYQDDEPTPCKCFHVCGFELYGQVHLE
ncbi:K+ channel tetramerization subfamily protein [Acanthamoeba castellanii str. Neff]|uniref:K+ channel tetramerisation subfamily protein n=1 Tax=Acanthamoeba castellanii (strain ATCC 30010 / Neff) TaxID=1257118 RepID=M0QSP2_ACACF|nr:K+ channel tetramerization subfamily protein [Acanthamoeba castellanii str. Neff]ELR15743.1 K+ channel tetramerisation subfamily protein [Acanthamoeba castellanii str. Neff]